MAFNPLEELDVAFLIIRRQKSVYHLNCEASDKISDVIRYLASLMKLTEEQIQLSFSDEILEPDKTLREYNLNQSTSPAENPCVLGMNLKLVTAAEFEPLEIIRYPPPEPMPINDANYKNTGEPLKPPTTLEFKGDYRGPEVAFQFVAAAADGDGATAAGEQTATDASAKDKK